MKKRVTKLAALALVAVMTVGTAVQASATTGSTAPTSETNVDSSIVTATAHRAASPLPEMLGANTPSGFGMINGGAPEKENALGNFALEVWGSATNNVNPDPYWCNYYYSFNGGSPASSKTLINLNKQGSPVAADTLTISAEYGGVSVSLYRRPDVLIGVAKGNDVNDDTGYDEQLATIATTGEVYNPLKVKYNSNTLETMIDTVYDAADQLVETGKSTRYGSPVDIAEDYENYIKGIRKYIQNEIGADNYKTIAIVSKVNDDGTYTIQGQGSTSATSANRYVEYTDGVTKNLTSQAEATATSEALKDVDAIILTSDAVETSVRNDATIMAGDPELIAIERIETLYGIRMNSVENALGMGYVLARIYDDELSALNVKYVYEYFASKFYHIKGEQLDSIYNKAVVSKVSSDEQGDLHVNDNAYNESALEKLLDTYAVK